jgi:magnesium-transporting ATPase (P-type)
MPDQFGINEGIKTFSSSIDTARESAKTLTKQIESIQNEGVEIAKQKAQERLREKKEQELKKRLAIHKALAEYRQRKLITEEEYKLKFEFLRQFKNTSMGEKEWNEILKIKNELEKIEKEEKKKFDGDLKNIRNAQIMCWIVAAWIAYIIVWGGK